MTETAPTYDLVLLLDPQAEPDARAKILDDARAQIAAQGELVRDNDWGDRALAYPIDRHANAQYHLLQFHAGTPALLSELDRTLRITDGVLRFRLIKLAPGTPEAPDMRSSSAARRTASSPEGELEPRAEPAPEAVSEPLEAQDASGEPQTVLAEQA
jgi:small subunit ribosomal protein S6